VVASIGRNGAAALACLIACACRASPAVEVPFDLSGNHVFVEARVRGEILSFVFDTGAEGTVIDTAASRRLGLTATGSSRVVGALGETRIPVMAGLSIELGALHLEDVTAAFIPLEHLEEVLGRPLDGIIGGDVLRDRVVAIDYDRAMISIHDRDAFSFEGWGSACPLTGRAGSSRVGGTLELLDGTVIEGDFAVDSGANQYLELAAPFVRRERLAARVGATYSVPGRALTGATTKKRVGHVRRFSFCGFEVPGAKGTLPVGLSNASAGVLGQGTVAGLLGNGILRKFNTVFDTRRARMFLRPNRYFGDELPLDASGLFLIRTREGSVVVDATVSASPSADAGILPGDVLTRIDGDVIADLPLDVIRVRLSEVPALRTLEVVRDGVARSVELRLRRLGTH